jgi:hypothetical protein
MYETMRDKDVCYYWSAKCGCLTIWRIPIELKDEFENEFGMKNDLEWGGLESFQKRTFTKEMLESGVTETLGDELGDDDFESDE